MPTPALGVVSQLVVGDTAPGTVRLNFTDCDIGLAETYIDTEGLRGSRSRQASRVRQGPRSVVGGFTLEPNAVELDAVLKYALGGVPTGTSGSRTFPLSETLLSFVAQTLKGASMFTNSGCRVNRAELSANKGTPMRLSYDVLGLDEVKAAASGFPALALAESNPFILEDLVLTVGGTTIEVFSFNLSIDNHVIARQTNSLTPTVVYTVDRTITWRLPNPFGDNEAMYPLAFGGVAVVATFAFGTTSLVLTSPKVQFPRQAPRIQGRDEIVLNLDGVARWSAAPNDELSVVLDSV